jgi:hypothetical protein
VITPGEGIVGILAGCVLIVFGLFPPPLQRGIQEMRDFNDFLSSRFSFQSFRAGRPRWPRLEEAANRYDGTSKRSWCLAGLGMAMIGVTMLAYVSSRT